MPGHRSGHHVTVKAPPLQKLRERVEFFQSLRTIDSLNIDPDLETHDRHGPCIRCSSWG